MPKNLRSCSSLLRLGKNEKVSKSKKEVKETFTLESGRECSLLRISNELIPNYYVLVFPESHGEPNPQDLSEMLCLGMQQAKQLAFDHIQDKEAYSVLYSGYSSRREKGWHIHIVLLGNRWRKAWLYLVLAGKNLLQAFSLRRDDAPRSIK